MARRHALRSRAGRRSATARGRRYRSATGVARARLVAFPVAQGRVSRTLLAACALDSRRGALAAVEPPGGA